MPSSSLLPQNVLACLRAHAGEADESRAWSAASWDALRAGGVMGWCIPAKFGGRELAQRELLLGYEQIAEACLTTAFILSQREAACRRIRDHGSEELRQELLPRFARGEVFGTVGLSQLTTSRQHTAPAMAAQLDSDAIILNGTMPWVTGAGQADFLVTGGVLADNRQLLAVVPRQATGVKVGPPLELMALAGSITGEVHCDQARLDRKWLLAGPAEQVLSTSKMDAGGLETSCLALGLARAAIGLVQQEARSRPELLPIAGQLDQHLQECRRKMLDLAERRGTPEETSSLRGEANTIVLRATQVALTVSKGAGFLRQHPAQRWVRQAMFFLVWSCPRPALEATLASLLPKLEQECHTQAY